MTTSSTAPEAQQRLAALAAYAAAPFPSLDDAINETLALLADLLGISLTMIHRLEGDSLVVSHACDRLGLNIPLPLTVPRAHTFCDSVLDSLQPLIVRDADNEVRWQQLPGKVLVGTRSFASVPIVLGNGRVFGTLCAHDHRVLELGQAEVDAMRILSRMIASQIERDDALSREAATAGALAEQNRELTSALQQLDALRVVVESISSQLDLQRLLRQVVESAVVLLNAHAGAISLIGESLHAPRRLVATYNLAAPDLDTRPIPSHLGLMGEVIARREPVIVSAYDAIAAPLPDPAFHQLAPWIAVPIWWQGEIIGTFGVAANDPQRVFGEREITVLALVAKHAAIGIANARLYAASHEVGIAEERNRLAREIHDTLAQSLLTLTFQLRATRDFVPSQPDLAVAELISAEAQARSALEEARRSVWNLGPGALETGSLVQALQAESDARRLGRPCILTITGTPRPLTAEMQLALLRVTQEALANARKHANCANIAITLDFADAAIALTVQDDGQGFAAAALQPHPSPERGFGLSGMRQRVQRLDGALDISSQPGQGTTICATLPYQAAPLAAPAAQPQPPQQSHGVTRRIVVVDDHPALRAGLVALLESQPDLDVVGQAADGEEAVRLIADMRPDVALMDLRLPRLGGVEAIARLTELRIPTRIIVVTSFAQDEMVLQALRAGAQGYLLKDASGSELAHAVRAVAAGGTVLTPNVAGKLTNTLVQQDRLTRRERQVLDLIGQGYADKEIAAALGTSAKTTQFHVANLLDKLGAQNRTDAVRIAYARGLLEV